MDKEEYKLRLEGFISDLVQGITKTFAERGVPDVLGLKDRGKLSEFMCRYHTELNVVNNVCLEAEEISNQGCAEQF